MLNFVVCDDNSSILSKLCKMLEAIFINNDIIDNGSIIQMTNTNLVAELIIENEIHIKQFGCYGDNNNDDTQQLQYAINFAENNNYVRPNVNDGNVNEIIKYLYERFPY